MTAKEHISEILKENVKFFIEFKTKRNLTERWNLENARAKDYHGRELLELLQNVDDAYEELCQQDSSKRGGEVEAFIEYTGNILRVQNNGTTFNEDSINRLCQGGVSGKKKYYIGNKGIGFRSVLNWASEIRLYSGEYAIRFSEEYAEKQLDKIKENSNIQKELEEEPSLKFPILCAPEIIEKKTFTFDTTIEITVKKEALDDDWSIEKQISEFDPYILLFLPNITKITFKKDNECFSFKKKTKKKNELEESIVQKIDVNNEKTESERGFFVFNNNSSVSEINNSDDEPEIIKLSCAIPSDFSEEYSYNMYTFFPIRTAKSPFHALMHATFILSQNRDEIINTNNNILVFKELLKFYVSVIANNFCKEEFGINALKLLCPINFIKSSEYSIINQEKKNRTFSSPFNKQEIVNEYIELCRTKNIFFTVNKEFISLKESPKLLPKGFPESFKGASFKSLLADGIAGSSGGDLKEADRGLSGFLRKLLGDECEFPFDELYEAINNLSRSWLPCTRVKVFAWWISYYKIENDLPHLLKDTNNNWITGKETVYFYDEKTNIPKWTDRIMLSIEDEKSLIQYYKENMMDFDSLKGKDDREKLQHILEKECEGMKFSNYEPLSLMATLNKNVGSNYERAIEFTHWLKQNYEALKTTTPSKLLLPSAEATVIVAEDLYFDKSWKEEIGEELFSINNDYKKLCSPDVFNIESENYEEWKKFFKWCKIQTLPRMTSIKLNSRSTLYAEFTNAVYNFGDGGSYVYKTYFYNHSEHDLEVNTIINIGVILDVASLKAILKWILSDDELRKEIQTEEHSAVTYSSYGRQFNNDYPCYLNYVFKNKKWIEFEGERYAPSDCLVAEKTEFSPYIPCLSDKYLSDLGFSADERSTIKSFLLELNAAKTIKTLSSATFYTLLRQLGEDDSTVELSKQIYRECLESGDCSFESSNERADFYKNGKLLTKNAGYMPVKEVFFSYNAVLNPSNTPLLDVPFNIGNSKRAKNIFFVEEYKENIVVKDYEISSCNEAFQKYFMKFLPYAFCYAKQYINDEIVKNIQLELASKISLIDSLSEHSEIIELEKVYSLAKDAKNKTKWFLFVGDIDSFSEPNKLEISKQIEILFTKLGVTDENILSNISLLFLFDNKDVRNYHIKKVASLSELKKYCEICGITEIDDSNDEDKTQEKTELISLPKNVSLNMNHMKKTVSNNQNIANLVFASSCFDDVLVSDEKEGDQAEQLIVQKLRNREIVEINDYFDGEAYEVNWVSSTSKRFEGNLNWDEKLGYDVELSSKSGKHLFIEIKSYWYDEISFYFSTNELKVAKEKGREYRLIFVGNRKEQSPTIHILPIEFIQNAEDGGNESFSFEISQYRCKKIEKY